MMILLCWISGIFGFSSLSVSISWKLFFSFLCWVIWCRLVSSLGDRLMCLV